MDCLFVCFTVFLCFIVCICITRFLTTETALNTAKMFEDWADLWSEPGHRPLDLGHDPRHPGVTHHHWDGHWS